MLSEHDCRILVDAFEILLQDFDPRDAVIFLEGKAILTEEAAEQIENKPSRLERLRALLRVVKRRAHDLSALIAYFEFAGQQHIADFLRERVDGVFEERSLTSGPDVTSQFSREKRLRKLLSAQVPAVRNHVKREAEISNLTAALTESSQLDGFFVVLHGVAGCGKTSLAAATLMESVELIGGHFSDVCFLRDSRSRPDQTRFLFTDLLLMLRDDVSLSPPVVDQMSSVALSKQILDALIDRPNILIVFDDVTLVDTVRWADQLGLRVLATTRNADLFSAATSAVQLISLGGLLPDETQNMFKLAGIVAEPGCVKAQSSVRSAHELCSGNPAVLGKLAKLSAGKAARLSDYCSRVREKGLSTVTCITSYEQNDVHTALSASVQRLSQMDREALAAAVIMPADTWIPVEVWALVMPVDLCGASDEFIEVRDQLCRLSSQGAWLRESIDGDAFLMTSLVAIYLRETVNRETIQGLSTKLEAALDDVINLRGGASDGRSLIQDFFQQNSTWFSVSVKQLLG